jgi:formiminotetrahydrofolate cyclodeaminase
VETLNGYLTNLGSASPAPGGGSAAMVVAATGCSLVSMVARICAESAKYASKQDLASNLSARADELREAFLHRKEQDERAYDAVVAARGDKTAMEHALHGAAAVPFEGAKSALEVLRLCVDALELGNANLVSDIGCAAEFAYAAMLACAYNVRINHKFMKDTPAIDSQRIALADFQTEAQFLLAKVRSALP